jgi:hypothetical protein
MTEPGCTCGYCDAREALQKWNRRAAPIVARLIRHGHRIDTVRMTVTTNLVIKLEQMHEACFASENIHRSHHLPHCPWAPRNRGRLPRGPRVQTPKVPTVDEVAAFNEKIEQFLVKAP